MRFAATFVRPIALLLALSGFGASASIAAPDPARKLDRVLKHRAAGRGGRSHVIVRAAAGVAREQMRGTLDRLGGRAGRALSLINGYAVELPNEALAALAATAWVDRVSEDRLVMATMERTGETVGAAAVRQELGFDGSGIGVAIIDSGAAPHDDLSGGTIGTQRVERFVDFIGGQATPYDDHGHGTHVAGIVAGNGFDSDGARTGIAPGARLIVLKALDASGQGRISDVIAALDYVVAHRSELNIRIVNLSIRAGVYESYDTDPLTLAAERAVRAGIVVVAAAGNSGRNPTSGRIQYGGVTAPGNAPWVITVGASSHMGTTDRSDDSVAVFSSRGPGAGGYAAKPDLVAPGVGIESLAAAGSTLYSTRSAYLLSGTASAPETPYLSLSGTSMAAPVVTATVALMLQANPSLTPNLVKAILQYTAEARANYDPLTQGAGFLNARGAVTLARHFASNSGPLPIEATWSRRLIWGNRLAAGGRLKDDTNAWSTSVLWGATTTPSGKQPRWGTICTTEDCNGGNEIPWSTSTTSTNVVWGSLCGGGDCATEWSPGAVFGTDEGVVWGMDNDAVVWGISDDGVVWGLSDDGVVWGLTDDGVVWGLDCSDPSCEPVVWGAR